MTWLGVGLGLLLLLALLLVLRLIETTYIRLGRARAMSLDDVDDAEGRLVPFTHDRETALGPVTLLRLACQVVIVTAVAVLAANRFSAWGVALVGVVAVLVLFALGEAVPRRWALESNDRMARALSTPVAWLSRVAPLRWIASPFHGLARIVGPRAEEWETSSEVVGDELVAMAEAAAEAQLLDGAGANLIGSVIELGHTIVREVMVPRPDMVTLAVDFTLDEALRTVVDSGFTRFPVVGDGVDDIVGLVLTKDLVAAQLAGSPSDALGRDSGLVREVTFVPESKKVVQLMGEMQAHAFHLAVVVDEYGGTAGLVTLEDLIEEVIGEIIDEYDDEQDLVQVLDEGRLLLSGRVPLGDLPDLLGIAEPVGDMDTVGGLVFDLLGHVPEPGEAVVYGGWKFVATVVEGRRIAAVAVERIDPPSQYIDDDPSLGSARVGDSGL